jgi:MFS transporter, ACS family, tartrate transporter
MLSWGILSGAMAFIPVIGRTTGLGNEYSFYLVRVLLGVAEAGFFPGIIFYLTLWFPTQYRARIVGYFMAAIPLSTVIGAPISGVLLYLHGGLGLAGWQWLFVIEALPAIVLAGVVFFYLTDRPADAAWLAPDERSWLADRLKIEQRQRLAVQDYSVMQSLVNPRVLGLSLVYFGAVATNYGLSFFLPQIVKSFGLNTFLTTVVSALPYVVGTVGMVWWGRRSDRVAEQRFHAAFPLFVAAAGIAVSTALDDPTLKMLSLCVAGFGIFACLPGVLDVAHRFPLWCRLRGRGRRDQFDRQPCGIRWSICDGMDQGPNRQLCRRFAAAGGARLRGDGHRAGARA